MIDYEIVERNQNKSYFVTDDSTKKELEIQGALMQMVRGVNYIQSFYKDDHEWSQTEILSAVLRVAQVEKLKWNNEFEGVDSFFREQVYEILMREN
jgi:hypothetical protein